MDTTGTSVSSGPPDSKRSTWLPREDALLIQLRGEDMTWKDIAERLRGRTEIACRLRFQNYIEPRDVWDEQLKSKLAIAYYR